MSVVKERLIKIVEDAPDSFDNEEDYMKCVAYMYKKYIELYGDDEGLEDIINDD